MRQYELTYLVADSVSDSEITKVSGKVNAAVTQGKILKEENWGRRKLAYPIKKQQFATYITINFELEPENLSELEHELKVAPEIIRHIILVKDFGKETLTLTSDEVAEAQDIEEAIGTERSFEVVEGETEESRDLMLKRDKDEEVESKEEEAKKEELNRRKSSPQIDTIDTNEDTDTAKSDVDKDTEEDTKEAEAPAQEESKKVVRKSKPAKTKAPEKAEVPTSRSESESRPESVGEDEKEEAEDALAPKKVVKPKTKTSKKESSEETADRLTALDKELDDILGDKL
jgi:small subunit ribosomal protein S6